MDPAMVWLVLSQNILGKGSYEVHLIFSDSLTKPVILYWLMLSARPYESAKLYALVFN